MSAATTLNRRPTPHRKPTPRRTTMNQTGPCKILRLDNPIQTYAWGSRSAIAELQGREPTAEPEAEMWMGAHPKAPSVVQLDGEAIPLHEAITRHPETLLGTDVHRAYGPRLPFLLKVLAAGEPLSIQAHPDREQATAGFAREQEQGIAIDAAWRNYRDQNHKPEIIYALTPFTALRGMRSASELAKRLEAVGLSDWLMDGASPREGLRRFLALDGEALERARQLVLDRRGSLDASSAEWIERLEAHYPGDRGVLAPVLLHLVELEPGQALFTGPGILHAYLGGVGVELMASSDNVLRCALTQKHVDGDELLRIARFDGASGLIEPVVESGVSTFETLADEFKLRVIELESGRHFVSAQSFEGIEILFCSKGSGRLEAVSGGEPNEEAFAFRQGDAFLVPGCHGPYRLVGQATVFSAGVSRCPEPR